MPYDPTRHHRRSTRCHGFDYASANAYFVTICAQDRACLFGNIQDNDMRPGRPDLRAVVTDHHPMVQIDHDP